MIKCVICDKEMNFIHGVHLKSHGVTKSEYLKLDPDAKFSWRSGLTNETSDKIKQSSLRSSESHKTHSYKEKYRSTMIEKYGEDSTEKIPELKNKANNNRKKTLLSKYGVSHQSQIQGVKEKTAGTIREKYKDGHPYQSEEWRQYFSKKSYKALSTPEVRKKISDKCSYKDMHNHLNETGYATKYEKMFHNIFPYLLYGMSIKTGIRYGNHYTLDFVNEQTNIIYEIDGNYHNGKEMIEHDKLRTKFLIEKGYKVVRILNCEVEEIYMLFKEGIHLNLPGSEV